MKQLFPSEINFLKNDLKRYCEAIILQWNKFILKNDQKIVKQLFANEVSLFLKMIKKILWSSYSPMK